MFAAFHFGQGFDSPRLHHFVYFKDFIHGIEPNAYASGFSPLENKTFSLVSSAESVLDYWRFKVLALRFDLLRKSHFVELLHRTCSLVHFVYSTPHLPKSAVSTILYISKILEVRVSFSVLSC